MEIWAFYDISKMERYLVLRAPGGLGAGDGLVDAVWILILRPGSEGFYGVLESGERKRENDRFGSTGFWRDTRA